MEISFKEFMVGWCSGLLSIWILTAINHWLVCRTIKGENTRITIKALNSLLDMDE